MLRLLAGAEFPGGPVTYLAEVAGGDPSAICRRGPTRSPTTSCACPYARPGGPAADLGGREQHVTLTGTPVQVKTWNLSSIWRLPDGRPARCG